MTRKILLGLAPLVLLAACGRDGEAVLETVRLTEKAHLDTIAGNDLEGIERRYEPDAVLVAPGLGPVVGKAAIRAAYGELLADPALEFDVTPDAGWVAQSGDIAVTTSTANFTYTDPQSAQPVTVPLRNQTVWRRPQGGNWLIVSDTNLLLRENVALADGS